MGSYDMDDEELLIFAKMANDHHDEIREKSLAHSLDNNIVEYTQKKKLSFDKFRNLLLASFIVIIVAGSTIKIADALTGDNLLSWYTMSTRGVTHSANEVVDKKIKEYEEAMGINGAKDTQVEIFVSHNPLDTLDPKVEYDNTNFYNDIVTSSTMDDPVTEVRCALIAAYRIINEPYRVRMFNNLFDKLKNNEEFINNTGFDMSGDIWKMLGYKDMEDFKLHAREDTKVLRTVNVRSNNGKGM